MARDQKNIYGFNGGEISPLLSGRVDLQGASRSCRILRNMVVDPMGAATRRVGLKFIAATKAQFGNVAQSCGEGFTGNVVAANTYFRDTQAEADARAAEDLVCTPDTPPALNLSVVAAMGFLSTGALIIGGLALTNPTQKLRKFVGNTEDEDFVVTISGGLESVSAILILPDDSIIFAGSFTSVNGNTVSNIAKVSAAGVYDATFTTGTFNGQITKVRATSGGNMYVLGGFTTIAGVTRRGFARLTSTGAVDATFVDSAALLTSTKNDFWEQSDGAVIIVYNTNDTERFSSTGTNDTTYGTTLAGASDARACKSVIVVAADKAVMGAFEAADVVGSDWQLLCRINSDGTTDGTFSASSATPGTAEQPQFILPQGTSYISAFSTGTFQRLVRFTSTGSIDGTFDTSWITTGSGTIACAAEASDGTLWFGGGVTVDGTIYALLHTTANGALILGFPQ